MIKYENYKKVNLPWIKKIPKHWELIKVKNIFEISKDLSYKENPKVLSLARDKIKIRNISNNEGQLAESYNNYNTVKIGDLLLNPMDLYSGANCNISHYDGVISPAYVNLRAKEKICVKYYDYIFKIQYTSLAFQSVGKGVSFNNRWTLSNITLLNYLVLFPSFFEQQQIAKYLDWKIEIINEIIQIEKQKIERLETLKQKYIDNIFGSLNCGKYIRLAKLGDFSKGGGFSRENLADSANEAILYGDIYTKYNYWLEKCISTIDDKGFNGAKYLQEPAILFTASGETKEDIGKAVAFTGNHKIAIGGDVIIFRVKKDINVKYISYFCNTSNIKYEKYIESTGEIIVHISSESLKNIKIPFITIEEQENIVSKIDSFIELQNKVISSKNIIIENYMKLKQSLISEVVTGQIDVRNEKIPERK